MTHAPRSLPDHCQLRSAQPQDLGSIRKLVWSARLDPTQLRWQQFWVIACGDELVACGQLRHFPQAQELGSLVVAPAWRHQGLGTILAGHLMQQADRPVYLECLGEELRQFYGRLGFIPVQWRSLPPALRWKFGFTHLAARVFRLPLVIMRLESTYTDSL